MTEEASQIEQLLAEYDRLSHPLKVFMNGIEEFIGTHPELSGSGNDIVHSYKSRLKDRDHLRSKIERKIKDGTIINKENFFEQITDLAGVRILHLFQEHFSDIDRVIRTKISDNDWILSEKPKAYTWDPEAAKYFKGFELDIIDKESYYTSVHYLVRPRLGSPLCCEIQVRTLFEEIWGEVDHRINYPNPHHSTACREQIRVLSKIVGAGSRLLDSLWRVYNEQPQSS